MRIRKERERESYWTTFNVRQSVGPTWVEGPWSLVSISLLLKSLFDVPVSRHNF